MFNDGEPEELIALIKNFRIEIEGKCTTYPLGWINYLYTMLRGQDIREIDKHTNKNHGTKMTI